MKAYLALALRMTEERHIFKFSWSKKKMDQSQPFDFIMDLK